MPWLSDLKRALKKLGEPEKPRAQRRPATGVTALFGVGSATTPATISDISITGIYLLTQERPAIGELITIMLRAEGDPETSSELQFIVDAQVAAHGDDGIGLSFVLPEGLDTGLWIVLLRNLVELSDRTHVAEAFRSLRIILFLCRLCGPGAEEAIALLGGQLDADHMGTLFKIAFAAENQLAADPDCGRMRAHPKLVAKILRDGAWAPDELIQQMWTGLFVSSCSVGEPDDSNQAFADLVVHLTTTECRIFDHACKRAQSATTGAGGSIVLTPAEMVKVTGVYDPYRNATDLAYLFNLGLAERVFDFTSYYGADSFDITPSALGLELYKHCHGVRGKLDPAIVESAKKHLATFMPPPAPAVASPAEVTRAAATGTAAPAADPAPAQSAVAAESAIAETGVTAAVGEPAAVKMVATESAGSAPAPAAESAGESAGSESAAAEPAASEPAAEAFSAVPATAAKPAATESAVAAEPEVATPVTEAATELVTTEPAAEPAAETKPVTIDSIVAPVATDAVVVAPVAATASEPDAAEHSAADTDAPPAAGEIKTPPAQHSSSDS